MMASVTNLAAPVADWVCSGVPLTAFFNIERRHGKNKPVIKKALVELQSLPFQRFASLRSAWALKDAYRNPGPAQLNGNPTVALCHTLSLEYEERSGAQAAAASSGHPLEGSAAVAAYSGLCEGLFSSAAGAPTSRDLQRALNFRLLHKITDLQHLEVLSGLGISKETFAGFEAAVRKSLL
jgi:hypothetical protein